MVLSALHSSLQRFCAAACATVIVGACASSPSEAPDPPVRKRAKVTAEPTVADPAPRGEASAPVEEDLTAVPVLPAKVDGGSIARPELLEVLRAGGGRFLQQVQTEPHFERGRFVGWRIVAMTPVLAARSNVVAPGDIVTRVNGQSIERPEQFQPVWENLATSGELVLVVVRAGQRSRVRYLIEE